MDLILAQEQVMQLLPKYDPQTARQRVEEKKLTLVAGMIGALISRPKPEEIALTYSEHRLEPFWHVVAHVRTLFDRPWTFNIPVKDAEVDHITTLGQDLMVAATIGGGHAINLQGMEHGEKQQHIIQIYGRGGAPQAELIKLLAGPKEPIAALAAFAPEGVLVMPPEVPEIGVIGRLLQEVVQPERVCAILEQKMEIESITLYFRPVYAFEFYWAKKSKDVVVELDGLTGEIEPGRVERMVRGVINPATLFDVSAETLRVATSTLGSIPGGEITISKQELVHR
jgi:hypothetical protein